MSVYEYARYTGQRAQEVAQAPIPMGMGLSPEKARRVETLVVWATDVSEPGPDYTELVAYDETGEEVGRKRLEGY